MTEQRQGPTYRTERFTAFVDAVVAIAMTLLILPLMESVSEAGANGLSTIEFLQEHEGQLFSFALSFVLIANFWLGHHRQYDEVVAVTRPLLWCNIAWMATIVWLPVPTAMLGQMDADPLQATIYIGTLILTQVTSLAARIYLLRHRALTRAPIARIRHGIAADIAAILLFGAALAAAASFGSQGYFALFLLSLTGVVAGVIDRVLSKRTRSGDASDGAPLPGAPDEPRVG